MITLIKLATSYLVMLALVSVGTVWAFGFAAVVMVDRRKRMH